LPVTDLASVYTTNVFAWFVVWKVVTTLVDFSISITWTVFGPMVPLLCPCSPICVIVYNPLFDPLTSKVYSTHSFVILFISDNQYVFESVKALLAGLNEFTMEEAAVA